MELRAVSSKRFRAVTRATNALSRIPIPGLRRTVHTASRWLLPSIVDMRLSCGVDIRVDLNEYFWRRTASRGFHEQETERFLVSILRPGDVFIDVGARVGIYTVLAGKLVAQKGCVFAFEPDPPNFPALQRSVMLNRLKNVSIEQLALGEENSNRVGFNVKANDNIPMNMGHVSQILQGDDTAGGETFHADVRTLDSFLKSRNIDRVNAVKVDVDGPELMILRGATELLKSSIPPVLIVEVSRWNHKWGYEYKDVHHYLTPLGYDIFGTVRQDQAVRKIASADDFTFDLAKGAVNLFCLIPERHGDLLDRLWFYPAVR